MREHLHAVVKQRAGDGAVNEFVFVTKAQAKRAWWVSCYARNKIEGKANDLFGGEDPAKCIMGVAKPGSATRAADGAVFVGVTSVSKTKDSTSPAMVPLQMSLITDGSEPSWRIKVRLGGQCFFEPFKNLLQFATLSAAPAPATANESERQTSSSSDPPAAVRRRSRQKHSLPASRRSRTTLCLTQEEEPTLEMMGLFDSFMYQFRQRGSLSSHSTASAVCPALYWLLQSKAQIFLCHTDANDASPPVLLTPSYCLSHNLQVWCHWHCKSTGPKKELT